VGKPAGQSANRKERKKGGGGNDRRAEKKVARGARKACKTKPGKIWAKGRKKTRRKKRWKSGK
jgi:hypothetical protein